MRIFNPDILQGFCAATIALTKYPGLLFKKRCHFTEFRSKIRLCARRMTLIFIGFLLRIRSR